MTLSLRNVNKSLERKISKCIALLGDEYQSLNFTLYFYDKQEKLLKEKENKPELKEEEYAQILEGKSLAAGVTIPDRGKIKIFSFQFGNLKKDPTQIIPFIATIYHEIRHAWQYQNNLLQNEVGVATIDENLEAYLSLPSEQDAYKFQENQMKKHNQKILEIFGFKGKGFNYELIPEIKKHIKY